MGILYVLLAILIFGVLIFIHELGHFLAARACGVTVNEFAIGMGPKLISVCPGKKRAQRKSAASALEEHSDTDDATDTEEGTLSSEPVHTVYSLRAFPIGGFVSMEGENEESPDPNSYEKKNVWQRMFILLAGPMMNIILGFVLMLALVCNSVYMTNYIVYDHEGDKAETVYLSESSGLRSEDKIIKVGNTRVHTGYEVVYEIMNQGYEAIDITVERDGVVTVIPDVVFPTTVESGMAIGAQDFFLYSYSKETVTFGDYLTGAFWRSCSTVKMVWDSLAGLFSGRYGVEAVSGPIGVTEVITDAAKTDNLSLLYIVTVITINLGVMNLLPFPALDGGHLFIYLIEAVVRKPIPKKIEGWINVIGFAVLMVLMVLIATKDIVGLVGKWFGGN